jgi:hypothetical protein
MNAFKTKDLVKPSLTQRLFNKQPKENGLIKINNLLANNPVKNVTLETVQTIASEYKINLEKKHRPQVLDLFKQFINYCLQDKHLSKDEYNDLKHLKEIFSLSDKEISKIYNEVAGNIYKMEVDKAVVDGKLDEDEVKFLENLKNNLRLSEKYSEDIYKESAGKLVQKFMNNAVSDERLSPDEEEELQAISKSLNVKLDMDYKTQAALDKYKLYWQIENSDLPNIAIPINIQKSEICYFHVHCDWLEQRRITKRINYGGPTLRIKIAKGVYWRAGSLGVQAVSEDIWQNIDSGDIYLTNKRIIFMGQKGNKTIGLNKILDFTVFSNGIDIQKDAGKNPFLQFDKNTDIFSMILGRAIREF